MSNDNVVKLIQPGILTDRLTEVLRDGARALLTQAVEAEVSEFLAATADLKTDDGCRRVVRHGHLPEREILTGIGPVARRACATGRLAPTIRRASASRRRPCRRMLRVEEPRYADPDPLFEGRLDRRLRAGAGRSAWQGCSGLSARPSAAEGRLDSTNTSDGASATCRPSSYVYVWADGVAPPGASRKTRRNGILVIIGAHAGGQPGAARLRRWRARERSTTGAPCCSISSAGVCRWRPRSPSPMARSASGRRSASPGPRPVSTSYAGKWVMTA